eukprot:XP_003726953.1 PREDICTED: uncharacterized protein LOC100892737 [Strongylocentrotus purpuratus]
MQNAGAFMTQIKTTLPNYEFHHVPRSGNKKGGGVAVLLRRGFNFTRNLLIQVETFEYIDLTVNSATGSPIRLVLIYRPPTSGKKRNSPSDFINELSVLMETLVVTQQRLLLVGDFNLHVDVQKDRDSSKFLDMLEGFDLKNFVRYTTHKSGHTLDLIISLADDHLVSAVTSSSSLPSDHSVIECSLHVARPMPLRVRKSFRKLKDIDLEEFQQSIVNSNMCSNTLDNSENLEALTNQNDAELRRLLDQHAPLSEKEIILRPKAPWYTNTLRNAKRERRKSERRMTKTGLTVYRMEYGKQCCAYYKLLDSAKADYFLDKVSSCNQQSLFRVVKTLSSPASQRVLPTHICSSQLAKSFANFFDQKIQRLRDELDQSVVQDLSVDICDKCDVSMTHFN